MVLLRSVSQKESGSRLTGVQLQTRRQMEYDALTACMNILAYCATEDQLAKQYLSIAQLFKSALSAVDVTTTPDSIIVGEFSQAYDWSTTTQCWYPICQPSTFNPFESIHHGTWSPTPYGPNVNIPYGLAFAGYAASGDLPNYSTLSPSIDSDANNAQQSTNASGLRSFSTTPGNTEVSLSSSRRLGEVDPTWKADRELACLFQ